MTIARLKKQLPAVVLFLYVLVLIIATYAELTGKPWFAWLSLTQY